MQCMPTTRATGPQRRQQGGRQQTAAFINHTATMTSPEPTHVPVHGILRNTFNSCLSARKGSIYCSFQLCVLGVSLVRVRSIGTITGTFYTSPDYTFSQIGSCFVVHAPDESHTHLLDTRPLLSVPFPPPSSV